MIFASLALTDAEGAILAHTVAGPAGTLRKGHVLTRADLDHLARAGHSHITAARLEPGDIGEDDAAARIATALAGPGLRVEAPATGRANIFAAKAGLFRVAAPEVDALNRLDPGLTVATLPDFAAVEAGRMVATVKIIPFALPGRIVERAAAASAPLALMPYRLTRVRVISTLLPGLKPSVIEKTLKVTGARLAAMGASITAERRVPHDREALAAALAEPDAAEITIVFGASAVVDAADVIPAALTAAGGEIVHFGMPVDPGNLLLLGRLAGRPVLGAPGCARSPRENGFDWVLGRLMAGIDVAPRDITGLGVGGLLMDIVSRPAPRAGTVEGPRRFGAIVLAAGRSSRMEGGNKLLATLDDRPLVAHAADAALAAGCAPVVVVTGHMADDVAAALGARAVSLVHNARFADGMASSLKAGLAALPETVEAVAILLGDMPAVTETHLRRLFDAYRPERGQLIVVPMHEGRRGNPVVLARRFLPDLMRVEGDVGARDVIRSYPEAVVDVAMDAAVTLDLDTRQALSAAGGRL